MARLVDNAGPLTGGALASRLHGHTHNGDEAATALVSRVLGNVCAPLYDMLGRWVLHGELHDPYSEFFVGHRAGAATRVARSRRREHTRARHPARGLCVWGEGVDDGDLEG